MVRDVCSITGSSCSQWVGGGGRRLRTEDDDEAISNELVILRCVRVGLDECLNWGKTVNEVFVDCLTLI